MQSEPLKKVIRTIVPRSARNWLRSPSKSTEWLIDCARFSFGLTTSVDLAPNLQVIFHPRAYKVYQRSQIDDPEQRAEFRNFLSYCSSSMLLYDIGAHFGIFSLAAVRLGGKAIAVDPSPTATHMIELEGKLNRCADKITVVCAAIGESSGTIGMISSGVFSDGYFKSAAGRPASEVTEVDSVTIDNLVDVYGVPTHIKIDVEGNEAAALRGAKNTLSRYSPLLFMELHNEMVASEGRDPNSALDLLSEHGYTTISLSGDPIGRSEILDQPIVRLVARRP